MNNTAAIYCRLSREDADKINKNDDSESIQNQKLLLMDYAMEHDMQIYKIYSDDDFSGTDANRPEWNRMLRDAQNGEFNVIICKTQSRFTRDMEAVEKYIHGKFQEWGIRFIGVVDGVDTNVLGNKKSRQINGLINEWYLEDLSENIRAVFRKKMEAGQFLGAFAPFGYKKSEADRHKLEIDEDAAVIVKKIYNLYLQGYSVKSVAQILSEENVPTPTQYKQNLGLSYQNYNASQFSTTRGLWGQTTIKRILNNEMYIGNMVQNREKKQSYKSKKVIVLPRSEWIIVENTHEPIIPAPTFYQVQQLLKSKRTVSKTDNNNNDKKRKSHALAGKIKCADCGASLVKTGGGSADGRSYVRCQLAHKTKSKSCSAHSINLKRLNEIVSSEIHGLINAVLNENDEILEKYMLKKDDTKKQVAVKKLEIKKIKQKIEDVDNALTSSYMDKTLGKIDEETFLILKNTLTKNKKELMEQENVKQKELEELTIQSDDENDITELAKKYADFRELTTEIVSKFINYITVSEKDVYDNQDVKIYWKTQK